MSGRLPTHVVEHIETTTGLPVGLTGGRVKPGTCPDCHATVLAGYDGLVAAELAIVDPIALTPQLEAACVLTARPTWRLWNTPGLFELNPRTNPAYPVTTKLTPANEAVVVALHICGRQLPGKPIQVRKQTGYDLPDEPPF